MKDKGSVTVFLTLMLSVIAAFIIALITSVRGYVSKSEAASAVDLAVRSCFAEYNRELFQRFHIPLIDSSYKCADNGIDRVREHFASYLESSMSTGVVQYVEVPSYTDALEGNGEYLYETAVRYAKEETGIDDRLSGYDDNAYFLTYLLDVCGNSESPSERPYRMGEIEYLLYGFDNDYENIRLAHEDCEEDGESDYEEYLIEKLEEEGLLLLRRRFSDLVTEYMRENGSPGFDFDKCYHSISFSAKIIGPSMGDYMITREYAYDDAKM